MKKLISLFLLLSLMLTALPVTAFAAVTEYPVISIDFDDGTAQGVYPTGNSTSKLDSSKSHSASYSLQILNRTETWNAAEWDMGNKMAEGNTYRVGVWVYHEGASPVTFQFSFKVNEGEKYTYCRQQVVEGKKWTYVYGKYKVPTGEISIKPYIEVIDSKAPFWVDDITISQTGGYRVDTSIEKNITSLMSAFADTGVTVGTSIGSTVLNGDITGDQKALITKHFDSIAIENQLKAQFVLDYDTSVSDLSKYNESPALDFTAAKPFFDFAKKNNLKISAQALVWFSMTPEWFFHVDYNVNKAYASRDVMLKRLESYIKGVLNWCETNYPGIITSWVVVNEAVDGDANPRVRNDNFSKTIGEDYIAKAFEYAHKYRPNPSVRYLYNDYNMEYYWEKTQFVIDYLTDHDIIKNGWVDGIGFQCHIKMDWPGVSQIRDNCGRVAAAGLQAEVTEIDIALGASQLSSYGNEFAAMRAQGKRYEEIIAAFMEAKANGLDLKNITWWGLTDSYTWLVSQYNEAQYPLLFDANNKAKPAFYGVLNAIGKGENPENLALNKETGSSGIWHDGHLSDFAVDGDVSTRWASQADTSQPSPYTGEYYWWVDLGSEKTFNNILINWEVCYGKSFVLQTKASSPEENSGWTDITSSLEGKNGPQEILFDTPVKARYIRMYATEKATSYGCSMYEFEVCYDSSAIDPGEPKKTYIGEDNEEIPLYQGLESNDNNSSSSEVSSEENSSTPDSSVPDSSVPDSSQDASSGTVTSDTSSSEDSSVSPSVPDESADSKPDSPSSQADGGKEKGSPLPIIIAVAALLLIATGAAVFIIIKKK